MEFEQVQELLALLMAAMVLFEPLKFGAIEFIKAKSGLQGSAVEWLAIGVSVFFAVLVLLVYFFPSWGVMVAAITLFLITAIISPSGYYKHLSRE